ncbi:MAG: tryptophan synthase subunit alpha [Flavobacteriales bacterium]|nr:tryptophan synthase subunit alpha [Flavobacteriales bacterium]
MNRIDQLIDKKENILSIYFTAGFPSLNDTINILKSLENEGADLIEIGIPFSDPLADGPTIQSSNLKALENGMTLSYLFDQLKGIRDSIKIPIVLMGYLNSVMQFGEKRFIEKCAEVGIDGVILPDLPLEYYNDNLKDAFLKANLKNIMLITPSSSVERIRAIDQAASGFIYAVSTHAITGNQLNQMNSDYFEQINSLDLRNKHLIGFGIHDKLSFEAACKHGHGGIIGSAFIKHLAEFGPSNISIKNFINNIRS